MTAIDHLRNSDTLRFPGISYHLHTPLGDSDSSTMPFCVTKPGGLEFTLTSEHLHLPIPGLNFPFTGVVTGNNITWTVDQRMDVWFRGAHITRAHGQIVTSADEITATLGTDCRGDQRVFEAAIASTGGSNTLTVDTSLGPASASNITFMDARAGEILGPVFFDVRISANQTPHDDCGHYYQLQGSTVRFTASVVNLRAVGNVTGTTFRWDTPPAGVTVTPGTDRQPTLEVRLDAEGTVSLTVHAVVTTDVETGAGQSTAHFAVLTADEALLQSLLCQLRSHSLPKPAVSIVGVGAGFTSGGIRFVDPLWDPTPDELRNGVAVLRRGYSLHELHQIRAVATSVARTASEVSKLVGHIIDQRENQSRLTHGK